MLTGYTHRSSQGSLTDLTAEFPVVGDRKHRLRALWSKHYVTARPFLPYVVFVFYATAGALVLHLVEQAAELHEDNRSPRGIKCLKDSGYWAALFYVVSVCSTIGFGVIYPCTTPTRVLSVLYSFVGIPLVLYILADLGKRMCYVVTLGYSFVYRKVHRLYTRQNHRRRRRLCTVMSLVNSSNATINRNLTPRYNRSYEPPETDLGGIPFVDDELTRSTAEPRCARATEEEFPTSTPRSRTLNSTTVDDGVLSRYDIAGKCDASVDSVESDEIVDVPISIGLIMLFVCMNLCALYYYYTECYHFWESVYYSLLTFLSGDFITQKFEWSAPVYLIIFLGFSTLTMTVTIVQNNMENMLKRVKREVQQEIIKQAEMEATGTGEKDTLSMAEAEDKAEDIMNEVMQKHGLGWMASEREVKKLDKFAKVAAHKRNAWTQTNRDQSPPPDPKMFATTAVSCPTERISKAVGTTDTRVSTASETDQNSETVDKQVQFCEHSLRVQKANQTLSSGLNKRHAPMQTDEKPTSDKVVAVHPTHADQHGQTNPASFKNQAIQSHPSRSTIGVQMSSHLYEGRGPSWSLT